MGWGTPGSRNAPEVGALCETANGAAHDKMKDLVCNSLDTDEGNGSRAPCRAVAAGDRGSANRSSPSLSKSNRHDYPCAVSEQVQFG